MTVAARSDFRFVHRLMATGRLLRHAPGMGAQQDGPSALNPAQGPIPAVFPELAGLLMFDFEVVRYAIA